MKVLIVAKTRMGSGACVGAISFEGKSLRLEAIDKLSNKTAGMEYEVGEVWEVEGNHPAKVVAPHVENFVVGRKERLARMQDPEDFIYRQMPPVRGSFELLFDGLTKATKAGALYIGETGEIPLFSTMFWKSDKTLVLDDKGKRLRYRYPTEDGGRTITFVGFQMPIESVEVGTLLRISLAHWWRPAEKPDGELRCYLQLSGWFPTGNKNAKSLSTLNLIEDPETHSKEAALPTHPQIGSQSFNKPELSQSIEVLHSVFGYKSFWPHQEKVITNLIRKKDTLAIMPTGSGKSLCYQLPALLFPGLTVVVSPLIALMQDQVDQLGIIGVSALSLNSSLTYSEYQANVSRIRSGEVSLLYISPETLLRPEMLVLLDRCKVNYLTIDEAHCISSWGHDFRLEYRKLIEVRNRLPGSTCFALTATATSRVQMDIKRQLGMPAADTIVASFNRPNLFLEVQQKTDFRNQILGFLNVHKKQPGIIYCATRLQVDTLAAWLADEGYSVLPYHAGLDNGERLDNQRKFTHDEVEIIVATIAFGMGINKPNVRFVIHFNMPKNLESYYQQIGRAGRDGSAADCLLLFSMKDVVLYRKFVERSQADLRPGRNRRLKKIIEFAQGNECRRRKLLAYFGEQYTADNCGSCDICMLSKDVEEKVDATAEAVKFLTCVKETREIYGSTHIISVLRGSKSKKIQDLDHHRLSSYGSGIDHSKKEWQELVFQYLKHSLLIRDKRFGSLKLTPEAHSILADRSLLVPKIRSQPGRSRQKQVIKYDAELFKQLGKKRRDLADEAEVPVYYIFPDRSLQEMATYFPITKEAFSKVFGVGLIKLEKFSEEFLPIIQDYCKNKGNIGIPRTRKRKKQLNLSEIRLLEITAAYNSGVPIEEIANSMKIKERTALKYLRQCAIDKLIQNIDVMINYSRLHNNDRKRIFASFDKLGIDFLRPIYEDLEEKYTFEELRIEQICYLLDKKEE